MTDAPDPEDWGSIPERLFPEGSLDEDSPERLRETVSRLSRALEVAIAQIDDLATRLGRALGTLEASSSHAVLRQWRERCETLERDLRSASLDYLALDGQAAELQSRVSILERALREIADEANSPRCATIASLALSESGAS